MTRLFLSQQAARQLKGCPTTCRLVEGKPCDPNATYTKIPSSCAGRPETEGLHYLCDPCLKIVAARVAEEDAKGLSPRKLAKAAKANARADAREAQERLRAALQAARTAEEHVRQEQEVWDADQRRLENKMQELEAEMERIIEEQRLLTIRLETTRATVAGYQSVVACRTPRPVTDQAVQQAVDNLDDALAMSDAAWARTTNSARRKHQDHRLHHEAQHLLVQQRAAAVAVAGLEAQPNG